MGSRTYYNPNHMNAEELLLQHHEAPLRRRLTVADLMAPPPETDLTIEEIPCQGGITGYAVMNGAEAVDILYTKRQAEEFKSRLGRNRPRITA